MYCVRNVTSDLLWVGADDRRLACFEGVYGVPDGVSYNSYLLRDDRTVLFDTVDQAVSRTFFQNVAYGLLGRKLDYLVISHMEPDHAATIEELVLRYPEVTIVCNAKIRTMLDQFFNLSEALRYRIVKEGDILTTGRHSFTFIMAPMVHWPEVMMTYDLTDRILFSADAFGTFGALNGALFNDEVDFFTDYLDEARRYYTNIVGKYGTQVQAVLKKAAKLDIAYVCHLHGFVWRSHFGDYLEKYLRWSSYTPEEQGVVIAYASVYGHTENTVNILACKLAERGIRVRVYDTSVTPASYVVSASFRYSHLVFASTTYNAGVFVTMENLLHDLVCHNLQGRKIALIENGSWAPTSGKLMAGMLEGLKGMSLIAPTLSLRSDIHGDQLAELDALADAIAADIHPAAAISAAASAAVPQTLEVEPLAFNNLTYGVEIVSTTVDGKDYGCVINTACQVAAGEPKKLSVAVIRKNHTRDMILKAGKFNISILTQETPFALIQQFGMQSGRDADKFAPYTDRAATGNGVVYMPDYANAVFSCQVTQVIELDTHTLFIGDIVEARVLSKVPSCTYGYYHTHIKPKQNPAPVQKAGYVCKVCGYFHEGVLPADYECPLCKHGPEDFEPVGMEAPKKKGYVCSVCGYFHEGELPADFTCPLCNHGPEDFEPAEQ